MLLRIFGEKDKKIKIKGKKRIGEVLSKQKIDASLFIIRKNKEIVLEHDYVNDSDEIELIPISSGG
ncbi:MAG: MoaD/ThiS family protein [Candidatus Parvarchaeota archaeon]|nr:MoaD/ThiS family protein [Candidatus Jingweiarchaeum tengchongense]MCW1297890.1 MoaD/ThiS family protein [Candidatus Jingweiarchaeum tengchongense]MCW1299901.1 MoaD/ThiS family protein [Candidatus Jingweiarchaeum tengchongense]MCW1305095.1 MoaD/ThiS family protein [Candidatus Jingweiarchaeum tengchongense]MCW1305157.1 MoaD/ThiS family protein [Candidatus Jingweiarchaeum tengchongense]